jgi:hypothetical protein
MLGGRDAIKPWPQRSWVFPRDPRFLERAGSVLDRVAQPRARSPAAARFVAEPDRDRVLPHPTQRCSHRLRKPPNDRRPPRGVRAPLQPATGALGLTVIAFISENVAPTPRMLITALLACSSSQTASRAVATAGCSPRVPAGCRHARAHPRRAVAHTLRSPRDRVTSSARAAPRSPSAPHRSRRSAARCRCTCSSWRPPGAAGLAERRRPR